MDSIAEYKAKAAEEARKEYEKGVLQRSIGDALRALNTVVGTRANENGVKTPEFVEYYRLVAELFSKYPTTELICYKADPILWGAFISQFGSAGRAYSVDEVNKKIAEKLNN